MRVISHFSAISEKFPVVVFGLGESEACLYFILFIFIFLEFMVFGSCWSSLQERLPAADDISMEMKMDVMVPNARTAHSSTGGETRSCDQGNSYLSWTFHKSYICYHFNEHGLCKSKINPFKVLVMLYWMLYWKAKIFSSRKCHQLSLW